MYYLSIRLDNEKIIEENRYVLSSLYEALDSLFVKKLGLEKEQVSDDFVVYYYEKNDCKDIYAKIIGMCISLKNNCEWFVDNVLQWELSSPDTGSEDLIEAFLS